MKIAAVLFEMLVAASAKSEAVTATEIDAGVGRHFVVSNDNSFGGRELGRGGGGS